MTKKQGTLPSKIKVFDIKTLDYNKVIPIDELRKNQLQLIKENPFIEIKDNKTYTLAKIYRTSLRKGRTGILGGERRLASQIRRFRQFIGDQVKELVDITESAETKQQEEITRWEKKKEELKLEKERLEAERIQRHQDNLSVWEKGIKEEIDSVIDGQEMKLDEILAKVLNTTGNYEEFIAILLEKKDWFTTVYIPQKREALRLEAERVKLEEEQAELAKKQEAQRVKEEVDARLKSEELAEKKRVRLLPDKERLIETFELLNLPVIEKFKQNEAQKIYSDFTKDFAKLKKKYAEMAANL